MQQPSISVIIPHYNGIHILRACLLSLLKNNFTEYEILVIDNGSTDGSQNMITNEFPQVKLIQNAENLGYAGGCNCGIKLSEGKYILLLNNDTEVADNFLAGLFETAESNPAAGFVQPKILSIQNKEFFDYSGGAGGEIDILGYPFTRGRLFDVIEKDEGQYDKHNPQIFWASGTACLIVREMLDKIGLLDEDFFAHMEEIDLNWRAHLCGYKSMIASSTYVYHYSGYTLQATSKRKKYLNHRNNLIMLLKNYSGWNLLWIFPIRIGMEILSLFYAFFTGDKNWVAAITESLVFVLQNFFKLWSKHKQIQKLRIISDRKIFKQMFRGSIVWRYFISGKKSAQQILT